MAFCRVWELDIPQKHITTDGRLTFTGHLRETPDSPPILYHYFPRHGELYISSSGVRWPCYRFHVERLSKRRFRLTPIPVSFTVEARGMTF